MDTEQWKRLERVYHEALEQDPARRAAFLSEVSAEDEGLAREAGEMLAWQDEADSFLEQPALEIALGREGMTAAHLREGFEAALTGAGRRANEDFRLAPGARLGPYEIEAAVSAGGMGEVYRARDTRLGRTVALKILASRLMGQPGIRARFEAEAKAISRLNHPNICTLHDIGRDGEIDYLVMEYLEGETLAARLKQGPLPFPELIEVAIQVCDALAYSHGQGVIHRDLKPGNIMLTDVGAKLVDFGLARWEQEAEILGAVPLLAGDSSLTVAGLILGTPQYMAPEQIERRTADARTDIFALGAVIFEMAAGRKAFAGDDPGEVMRSISAGEAPSFAQIGLRAPEGLGAVVDRCLRRAPEERWQSAAALGGELRQLSGGATVTPRRRAAAQKRGALIAAGLVLCAMAGGDSGPEGRAPIPAIRRDTILRTLHSFPAAQGDRPDWPDALVPGPGGVFYGASYRGGSAPWAGEIFQLDPPRESAGAWRYSTLYAFTGASDGASPAPGLLPGNNGRIYGATAWGGVAGNGTVFELTPPTEPGGAWTEKVLHHFTRQNGDGCYPNGHLIWGKHGELYGTTQAGGVPGQGMGIVFALLPPARAGDAWTERVVYTFNDSAGGSNPETGLIMDSRGALYGTTGFGSGLRGVLFKLTPPASGAAEWTETVVHRFAQADEDGSTGMALIWGPRGEIYGAAARRPRGSIFVLRPPPAPGQPWRETVLYRFTGALGDGLDLTAGLALASNGNLIGATGSGAFPGPEDRGTIFELSPPASPADPWKETILYRFNGKDGAGPDFEAPLLIGPHTLMGVAREGGPLRGGTVFELTF